MTTRSSSTRSPFVLPGWSRIAGARTSGGWHRFKLESGQLGAACASSVAGQPPKLRVHQFRARPRTHRCQFCDKFDEETTMTHDQVQCKASFKTPDNNYHNCQWRGPKAALRLHPITGQHWLGSLKWRGTANPKKRSCGSTFCPGGSRAGVTDAEMVKAGLNAQEPGAP